jgi:hypothetical protein
MQRIGLEWLHRLVRELGRRSRRYVLHDMPFAAVLAVHALRSRRLGAVELTCGVRSRMEIVTWMYQRRRSAPLSS